MVLYALSAVLVATDGTGSDFHRRQAAALADGHLDIRPVPVALTSLPDPYDPEANLNVRVDGEVQDLAYRDGRLYSAHGLTVPLLLVPSELMVGTSPPNWAITLVGAWTAAGAGAWTLAQVRRRFVPDLPDWAAASSVFAFGLCGPLWAITSVGNGYEAAIAVAAGLSMLSAGLLLRATEALPRLCRWRAALGSTLMALAVGTRPTAVVGAVVLGAAAWAVLRCRSTDDRAHALTDRRGDLCAIVGPFAAIIALLAMANLFRFGSPVEFGFGEQLSVWNMTEYPMNRPGHLVPNLADYAAAAPDVRSSFPWISLRATIGGDRPSMHTSEPIVGLLFCAPVLVVGLAALLGCWREMRRAARDLWTCIVAAAATGSLALVAVSLPFNTSSLRYGVDGAPWLLLAACGSWAWARNRREGGEGKGGAVLDRAWLIALVIGIAVTAAVQVPV